jgi:crossover junction endodeoxyribonuclease RuvC
MTTLVAIDPGASGGIVFGDPKSSKDPALVNMPETVHDLAEVLRDAAVEGDAHAFVELVGGYIGKAQPASSAFVFGENYGKIQGVLAALGIPFTLVRPQKWQLALSLGNSKGMTKSQWKGKLKAKAQQLYPQSKVTLQTADALLIWHAAKHKHIAP